MAKTSGPYDPDEDMLKFLEEHPEEAAIILKKRANSIDGTRPTLAGQQGVEAQKRRTDEAGFLRDLASKISPDKKG